MQQATILVLDQPTRSRHSLVAKLETEGWTVVLSESLSHATSLEPGAFGAVLAERAIGGDELAEAWSKRADAPPLLLFDAFASRSDRDSSLPGVTELVPRPVPDAAVLVALRRILHERELEQENRELREVKEEGTTFGALTTRDANMRRVFHTLELVGDSRASILVRGESGTGKTELARAVHALSNRREGPFVAVNCGALSETLLASELFGHVKGAFTGAISDRTGKYESADGGTLFLDEIGTAPMDLQVKLLRVLEEGHFERVGESATREADVRVVAATNEDLEAAVAAKAFRKDLFYRLNVVAVEVPPLRERPDDVLLLAERFLRRFAVTHHRPVEGFESRALRRLTTHDWPGNVRELQNTIERAVLLARKPIIGTQDLWPGEIADAGTLLDETPPWALDSDVSLREAVEASERWWIVRALEDEGGSRQNTARRLGINRTTLFNKMRKYDLLSFPTDGSEPGENDLGQVG